jgi:tRNA (guanine-N7-)-methyltransferase
MEAFMSNISIPSSSPSADEQDKALHQRPIRSFVRRQGRIGSGQIKALQELAPLYCIPFSEHTNAIELIANLQANVPANSSTGSQNSLQTQKIVFEIGFGMGEATAKIATTLQDTMFIACEVHEPGIGALLQRIDQNQLSNIRIIAHDAVQVLAHMIPKTSLDGIHIFFPDPWHKKRHNKRRLIQPPFVATLAQHLKPGGYIHCATDWQPYAEQMLQVLSAEPALKNTAQSADGYAEKPHYRPLTKFENRGIKLGHGVWDLVFKRV